MEVQILKDSDGTYYVVDCDVVVNHSLTLEQAQELEDFLINLPAKH